ncbi:hypothetical protein BC629DRAFT_1597145 [Irpex lacteus]|nr:hypothetical protein BC629DRAFT_1597145 [Irpex lacteus]
MLATLDESLGMTVLINLPEKVGVTATLNLSYRHLLVQIRPLSMNKQGGGYGSLVV